MQNTINEFLNFKELTANRQDQPYTLVLATDPLRPPLLDLRLELTQEELTLQLLPLVANLLRERAIKRREELKAMLEGEELPALPEGCLPDPSNPEGEDPDPSDPSNPEGEDP